MDKENAPLFGDGNVSAAFDQFEKEHVCNKFCTWFDLSTFVDVTDSDSEVFKLD